MEGNKGVLKLRMIEAKMVPGIKGECGGRWHSCRDWAQEKKWPRGYMGWWGRTKDVAAEVGITREWGR